MTTHPFNAIFNSQSKILILGSLPSVKSRENNFYYGHPQNRFWNVLSDILDTTTPKETTDKINFLNQHHIALWDVISSCDIKGSSDSSIKNVKVNDFTSLFEITNITIIFTNGQKAYQLYMKHCDSLYNIPVLSLPSTSPANQARFPYDKLKQEWKVIKNHL